MARRAGRERRRRRILAGVGAALALVLIVGGAAWLGGAFDSDDTPADTTAADQCIWSPQSTDTNKDLKDVGTPATTGLPESGTEAMTITTNQGAPITVALDIARSLCGSASLSFLAGKQFYDKTACTEITADGALRCGDPAGTGLGGPTYSFADENIPLAPTPEPSASAAAGTAPLYPKGTVALIGNPPGTNGSQFLIFLKDFTTAEPRYPVVGIVDGGSDTLAKIAKIATVDNGSGSKVKPKEQILIQSLTVGAPNAAPAAVPSASSQS